MTTPAFAYTVTNGRRVVHAAPAVGWRRKGCATCRPITVPTRPTQRVLDGRVPSPTPEAASPANPATP